MNQLLTLALMEGDGIGPEISAATREVLQAADTIFELGLQFREIAVGFAALEQTGSTFPEAAIDIARECDGIILGPVSHNDYPPRDQGGLNPSAELRKRLALYANIRPARTQAGIVPPCGKQFDLIIVRENTEGFYADRSMHYGIGEFMPTPDLAMSLRKITRDASTRISEAAFALAASRRGKVSVVHKANVLRVSDGLFLECARAVSESHPEIDYEERIVDAMCAHLVRDPGVFDVVCTTNMYGDILSDLASELAGSLGLATSLNAGAKHAMAQAQHGSAPDIAGLNVANPTALIGSAAMLLRWLGEDRQRPDLMRAAAAIEAALEHTLSDPDQHTADLGGHVGTTSFAQLVARALRQPL